MQTFVTVSPTIGLDFYNKWTAAKWDIFKKYREELSRSPMAISSPLLFLENDKYTILYYGRTDCPEKSTEEIETILREHFKDDS
ncbi:MAG: hypothetical protein HYW05_00430 [Candidatus Diapherotrites archaeon]|nr:hypothetical protein [Candidatus Diapherotrites archaeon]